MGRSGSLAIGSPDPRAPPVIHANYLHTAEDRETMIAGVRLLPPIAAAQRAGRIEELREALRGLRPYVRWPRPPGRAVLGIPQTLRHRHASGSNAGSGEGKTGRGSR